MLWLLFSITAVQPVSAFRLKLKSEKPTVDFAAWVSGIQLPDTDESGHPIFYPVNNPDDSVAIVEGVLPAGNLKDLQAYYAAMVYAISNLDTENGECVMAADNDGLNFTLLLRSTQGESSRETTYTRNIKVTVSDGNLHFRVTAISAKYREKGIIPRTLALEKLHPESNSRHGELVTEFSRINSEYLNGMASYVASREDISVSHPEEIRDGKVVTGMNADEVILVKGAPFETRKSGERRRWIYGDGSVVIFTDGKVSRVVGQ